MIVRVHLYSDPTVVGKAIQWQTRSPYNHAAVEISGVLFEATAPAVRATFGEVRQGAMIRETVLDDEKTAAMYHWLTLQLGKPYDVSMVLRFVSRQQETRKSRGKWFCSELVAAAFQHVGWPLFSHTEPWEVPPGLLARTPRLATVAR